MKILLLAMLATVTIGTSTAVSAKSRWYQVEVIVFNHVGTGNADGEVWPNLESLPEFRDAINLFVDLPKYADERGSDRPNEVALPGPLAFQSLPAAALKMSGVFRRLKGLGSYNPILHVGWRQPGLSGSRARNVYIADKPRVVKDSNVVSSKLETHSDQRVEGTVQVRTGQLLYVVTDFVNYLGEAAVRITEQRKVKLNEIHYFDHPLFGVIVQVSPYRIAKPAGLSGQGPAAAPTNDE